MSKCLVFIATAWGSRYGGINSFNYDLCVALAKLAKSDLSIVCIVSESKDGDKQDAEGTGVTLICLKNQEEEIEILSSLLKDKDIKPTWIIGHDVHSEPRASKLSKHLNIPLALFNHMNYSAYKSFQILKTSEYIEKQEEALKKAEVIFPVGPKLKELVTDIVSDDTQITEILPGLTTDLKLKQEAPIKFSAITLGRFGRGTDPIKQTSLAVASFAHAVNADRNPLRSDPELRVIGFQDDDSEDFEKLHSIAEKYTARVYRLNPWEFTEEKSTLVQSLCHRTVCMVPSLHEGFGLVGLEAISAEIPLILSQNTGLYEAIRNSFGKKGLDCLWHHEILKPPQNHNYHENNVKPISDFLVDIFENKKDSKESAKSLRQLLLNEGWTWESTARGVLEGLNLGESHSNEIPTPSSSSTQSASELLQKNVLDYPTSLQQFDETQEQFLTLCEHNTPQLRVVSSQSVSSKAEIPTLRKEILDLKREIDCHLRFLENTEIKRILEEDSPYPQWFESITECPIPIETILQTFEQLIRTSENLECVAQLNHSCQLVRQSKLAFNHCLQQISTLRQCSNRQSSRYVTALRQARDSFELAMQNLRNANSVLEQLAFLT